MKNEMSADSRLYFIDNLKTAACILVVIGHFVMSMAGAKLLPDTGFYADFIRVLYTFHVPIFFVCSGFLYQHSNRVHSMKTWADNVRQKLLNLGVPYFTFSAVTLLLKIIFEDSVNFKLSVGITDILRILFLEPYAPYWYLYSLFFLFLILPCMNTKKGGVILLTVSLLLWGVKLWCGRAGVVLPYLINTVLSQMQWFAFGMLLALFDMTALKKAARIIVPLSAVLSGVAIWISVRYTVGGAFSKVMGICLVLFCVFAAILFQPKAVNLLSQKFSKYFMAIFVTHTIFSAGVRILLLKAGIHSLPLHIVGGVLGGIVIPILVYGICEKIPVLLFFFAPSKAIKRIKEKRYVKDETAA